MRKIMIIDSFGYFFRAFHALPPLTSESGFPTGLLTGFVNFVNRVTIDSGYDLIAFAADSPGGSFRNKIYPEYKANRKEPDEALKIQIPIAIEWIKKMGFALLQTQNYEADDVIASVALAAKELGFFTRIVSGDKDMYQLIDDEKIVIFDAMKHTEIDSRSCYEKFGVYPNNFIDFQAILGDSSDNVPGVKGIGQKGAANLISIYGTLENIYANIDNIGGRTKDLLEASRKNAFLSRELVTLKSDAVKDIDFAKFAVPSDPISAIKDELEKYDIRHILRKNNESARQKTAKKIYGETARNEIENAAESSPFESVLITDDDRLLAIIEAIPDGSIAAFDTETSSLNVREARIAGFSFAYEENRGFYAAIGHHYLGAPRQISPAAAKSAIERLFAKCKIIAQNAKFDLHILNHVFSIADPPLYGDTMIMAWLINPSESVGLDELSRKYLNHEMISFKEATRGLKNFSETEVGAACRYAAEDAVMTLRLYPILLSMLDENAAKLLNDVELPFVRVLMAIEDCGLIIDKNFFAALKTKTQEEIAELTARIYNLAGGEFNINSPQQLGEVLFGKLKLPSAKKTKTGYSTDESVLSALAADHPIAEAALAYRELFKLRSTYIDPLLSIGEKSGRAHTNFSQVGTATGRLSSSEPNLQNIPSRTQTGRQIRRGFIAEKGKVFISADYSQIELRLLAHFSGDSTMISAFKRGNDIHLETARELFGENAAAMRNTAKSVNFGLIYGMGARKLSSDVKISAAEAREVIENYFAKFPTIKNYLDKIKRDARLNGFVDTLLGRKRFFDFERASDRFIAAYEREAVNTKFQGSAADLIKLAMMAFYNRFNGENRVKMVLQIHDELLFSADEDYAAEAGEIIKDIMRKIYPLNVPLEVSISAARSWADLK